jgi:hypothetical protein
MIPERETVPAKLSGVGRWGATVTVPPVELASFAAGGLARIRNGCSRRATDWHFPTIAATAQSRCEEANRVGSSFRRD